MSDLVVVREYSVGIRAPDRSLAGVRIAHLTDLHFERWNRVLASAQAQLLRHRCDLIAVTGDFANWSHQWRRAVRLMRTFFAPIADRCPIYATLGNHDHAGIARLGTPGVTFLRNECTDIRAGAGRLRLAGLDQLTPGGGDVAACLSGPGDLPTVLLAHYPSTVYRLRGHRVDLQLSGHTHGGQIRFPMLGCLWSNDRIPRRLARGLHRVGDVALHVSAGVGVSLPVRVRINCPPEISILTLDPVHPMRDDDPHRRGHDRRPDGELVSAVSAPDGPQTVSQRRRAVAGG